MRGDDLSFPQQKNLGKDRAGLQWWIIAFGTCPSGWYAVAREYYTNEGAKAETINMLSSRYGVPYDKASSLYFTEYRFEYTPDGAQFTEVSRSYYDMLGEDIWTYNYSYVTYYQVIPNTVQSKGVAYAMGRIR